MDERRKWPKPCETCRSGEAEVGERFCKYCRKSLIKEMEAAGYLRPLDHTHVGARRPAEAREVTHETKYGIDR